jgi:hypothetical protein
VKPLVLGAIFAVICVGMGSASPVRVTASDALALAEKLCTIPKDADFVGWSVISSNGHSNQRDSKGDYWLVTGQYNPVLPPGMLSIIMMHLFVPKDGRPPRPCDRVSV